MRETNFKVARSTRGHRNRGLTVIGGLLLLFFAQGAMACIGGTGWMYPSAVSASKPADGNWTGKQIGSGLAGQMDTAVVLSAHDGCSGLGAQTYTTPADAATGVTYSDGKYTYPVYPTGVANIGYVALVRDHNATNFLVLRAPRFQTYPAPGTRTTEEDTYGWAAQLRFVATGPLAPGVYSLPGKVFARVTSSAGTNGSLYYMGTTVTIVGGTCKMTTPANQSLVLPQVSASGFTGVGSQPLARSPAVNITIACDPGVKVTANLSDAVTPGNTGDALTLSAGSTAFGAGTQLYRDGLTTPQALGPSSAWLVGSSASAMTYTIPFIAGYVQTGTAVAAGSVNSRAIVSFSYE